MARELEIRGVAVSPGIAIGNAYVQRPTEVVVPNFVVDAEKTEAEVQRLRAALAATREEIRESQLRLEAQIGEDHAKIFDAHLLILEDTKAIEDTEELIRTQYMCAEFAFNRVIGRILESFEQIGDSYLKERRADVRDVRRRLLHNLTGQKVVSFGSLNEEAILVAHDLSPSDTAMLDRRYVLAACTDLGGRTSHAAIMARSYGIPAVVGVTDVWARTKHGDAIIVDGNAGVVVLRPTPATVERYETARQRFQELERQLLTEKDHPAITLDGRKIELSANVKSPDDAEVALSKGAKGIGLYRTEYFFVTRDALPGEEEQVESYTRIVRAIAPEAVIFRALDIGGDKFASYLGPGKSELNPFLGWRGIRFLLTRRDIFRTQLRAFLRASVHGKVKIMFPMITGLEEVRQARALFDQVREELRAERHPFDETVEVGIMIETPGAVAIADLLARETDFFSIGSNDLIQYTLAVDRGNARISYLYEPMHPSILRMIRNTVEAGHAHGIWVGMCGEVAGDLLYSVLLVGLGLDELSISAYMIPEVKRIIRGITYDEAKMLARKAMGLSTAAEIRQLVAGVMHARFPELVAAEDGGRGVKLLDDAGALIRRDPGGMLEQVRGFPAQLARAAGVRDAFGSAHAGFVPLERRPAEAVICGMGGSAIGGDYAAAWAAAAGLRVSVHRGYGLPEWVGARHLLVFSSYSGGTEETLSAYRAAAGVASPRVCIATGGELADCARRDGVPLLTVPGGLQPRAALGHSLVAQLVVLNAAGLGPDAVAELAACARRIEALQSDLGPAVPSAHNPAKQLAERLHGVLPFLCSGDGPMRVVATRIKGQLNENAETLAIASVLPEMNHNEIMAWSALPEVRARVRVLFLADPEDPSPVRVRMRVTRELLAERVQGCDWQDASGSTRLERMLSTTHLFDYASVYLAFLNDVDPTPVELIARLKERLAAG